MRPLYKTLNDFHIMWFYRAPARQYSNIHFPQIPCQTKVILVHKTKVEVHSHIFCVYLNLINVVAMIKQFLSDVVWRNIDYLVIDTPPGTSDEHIAVVESLKRYNPDGAILVTTPQVCV